MKYIEQEHRVAKAMANGIVHRSEKQGKESLADKVGNPQKSVYDSEERHYGYLWKSITRLNGGVGAYAWV